MNHSIKRLPDGEFAILKIIWHLPNPTTSAQIMEKLGLSSLDGKGLFRKCSQGT